jgi:heat shock protein HslJ
MPTIPTSVRVLAGLTILVLAACDSTGSTQGTTPEPASAAADLAGTSWTLVSVGGAPVVEGGVGARLAFDAAGNVGGSTGCNSVSGTYALDGTSLTFGPLMTTRMACEEPLMAQETAVLDALAAVEGWEVDADGNLHLTGGTELVLEPPAA